MRYGIRTETVTIDQELYKVSPLKGKFYADFMNLATVLETKTREAKKANPDVKEEELMIGLDADDYKLMHELATESLIAGDPSANRDEVELFAAQNLMLIAQAMMKVNSPK